MQTKEDRNASPSQSKSLETVGKYLPLGKQVALVVFLGLNACSPQPNPQLAHSGSATSNGTAVTEEQTDVARTHTQSAANPKTTENQPATATTHSPESNDSKETSDPDSGREPAPSPAREFSRADLAWPSEAPCGAFSCFSFDGADRATGALILHEKPVVVGFGDAHAPQDYGGLTTVERFTDSLLPVFAPGVSFLVVELLAPPASGCEAEKRVAQRESEEITRGQATGNQNQYLELGHRATELGIAPDILRASCEDLRAIASPKGGVLAYMTTIARLFEDELLTKAQQTKPGRPLTVAYGGALHNDRSPRSSREDWSYARGVVEATGNRFLEVDLIVPELIRDTDSWRSFPWYEAYRALDHREGSIVMRVAPESYVVFFQPSPEQGP